MSEELKIIEKMSGMQSNACACDRCVNMCKTAPCIGTPQDMMNIIEAGFVDRVELVHMMAGVNYGLPPVDLIAPKFNNDRCTFLDANDRCELHALGLKPTEGKLANHGVHQVGDGKYPPAWIVMARWNSKKCFTTVMHTMLALLEHLEKNPR